jgi:hypothetical protein
MKVLKAALKTCFLYGFAGWIYIAFNAVFHMETLSMPLTHLLPYPREDTFGIVCFGISFVSYFILNLLNETKKE